MLLVGGNTLNIPYAIETHMIWQTALTSRGECASCLTLSVCSTDIELGGGGGVAMNWYSEAKNHHNGPIV